MASGGVDHAKDPKECSKSLCDGLWHFTIRVISNSKIIVYNCDNRLGLYKKF